MKSCPICGTQVNDDTAFCTNCGAKLPQADAAGSPAIEVQPQTQPQAQPQTQPQAQPQTPYSAPVQEAAAPAQNFQTPGYAASDFQAPNYAAPGYPAPGYQAAGYPASYSTGGESLPEQKKLYVPGLVLGIVAIVGGLLIAIIGWITGTIGIILSATHMKDKRYNATAGLVTSIIGLVLSLISSLIAIVIANALMSLL